MQYIQGVSRSSGYPVSYVGRALTIDGSSNEVLGGLKTLSSYHSVKFVIFSFQNIKLSNILLPFGKLQNSNCSVAIGLVFTTKV